MTIQTTNKSTSQLKYEIKKELEKDRAPQSQQQSHNQAENITGSSVVLLSGGLDSVVAFAEAVASGGVTTALTFNYGQRAFAMEEKAAMSICAHYEVPHQVAALPWLEMLLPKAMALKKASMFRLKLPEPDYSNADVPEETKQVWVPNRNGVFLNIAAAFAEAHGASRVVFGANADEAQSFPDNTEAYRDQLTKTFEYSTLNKIKVWTPVSGLNKAAIVQRGLELNVPLDKVWSCYEAGPIHCGKCASCTFLKTALAQSPNAPFVSFQ